MFTIRPAGRSFAAGGHIPYDGKEKRQEAADGGCVLKRRCRTLGRRKEGQT